MSGVILPSAFLPEDNIQPSIPNGYGQHVFVKDFVTVAAAASPVAYTKLLRFPINPRNTMLDFKSGSFTMVPIQTAATADVILSSIKKVTISGLTDQTISFTPNQFSRCFAKLRDNSIFKENSLVFQKDTFGTNAPSAAVTIDYTTTYGPGGNYDSLSIPLSYLHPLLDKDKILVGTNNPIIEIEWTETPTTSGGTASFYLSYFNKKPVREALEEAKSQQHGKVMPFTEVKVLGSVTGDNFNFSGPSNTKSLDNILIHSTTKLTTISSLQVNLGSDPLLSGVDSIHCLAPLTMGTMGIINNGAIDLGSAQSRVNNSEGSVIVIKVGPGSGNDDPMGEQVDCGVNTKMSNAAINIQFNCISTGTGSTVYTIIAASNAGLMYQKDVGYVTIF